MLGIFIYRWVGFALIISGLGNAFFHVGGGVIILNLRPGKASLPGIYVAPGAMGLLISAPLLFLGVDMPLFAIVGVFLFNLTMPVTLVITSIMLPGKPGFDFGLTTLALIIGVFPTFTGLKSVLCSNNGVMIMGTVLIMALLLRIGLKSFLGGSGSNM
ncbi:hypothetical protein I6U48_24655 [Clostridium sp. PL3]|uniref:Uncharacterized protein n=1 Tax=Clostridium thailandense TaxID=2794346 RepID=A0A949U2A0_9CLOT|nr:hypothetical protein [Clostridium thailandense]MBV7276085.1 hypothetical protein [Clostridium thailandense]